MNSVAFYRWLMRTGWLAMGLVLGPAAFGAAEPAGADPTLARSLAAMTFGQDSEAKRAKLTEAVQQAARSIEAAAFDTAARWLDSALALNPADEAPLRRALAQIHDLARLQQQARAELPTDAAQRDAQLAAALKAADELFAAGQFEKARQAYAKIWLVAGDADGRTLRMIARCDERLRDAAPTPPAVMVAAANDEATVRPAPTPTSSADAARMVAMAAPAAEPTPQATPSAAQPAVQVDAVTNLNVVRLLQDAERHMSAGNKAEARAAVLQALDLWPDHPQARQMLERINQGMGATPAEQVQALLAEGDALLAQNKPASAVLSYQAALRLSPGNQTIVDRIGRAEQQRAAAAQSAARTLDAAQRREIDALMAQAQRAYDGGDLENARKLWSEVLARDPANKIAQEWLARTQPQYERLQADRQAQAEAEARQQARERLLNAPVTITTEDRRIPLTSFMFNLSLVTPVELQYSVAEGADAQVQVNFVNKPLREVLDTVLLNIGLTWSIDDRNVITIKPNLIPRTFMLTPEQMSKVRVLYDSGQLQRLVWGQSDPPSAGCEIAVDERQNMLMVTGSQVHLRRIEDYLQSLRLVETPELVIHTYKIDPAQGPRIKALINSVIPPSTGTMFDLERKVVVEDSDLIIRDTPENIQKIEELLLDKNFIRKLSDQTLDIANFSLVPREIESIDSDQVRVFTSRVVEAIETFLYAREGKTKAAEEGRRLWFDESTLQLTIVDTPSNLARVGEYIDSLPEIRQRDRQKVIFLKHIVAEQMASSLATFLGLTGGIATTAAGANETVIRLSRGDEATFRDITIRAVRFQANNLQDIYDDTVELSIVTPTGISTLTLRELETQTTQDYQFTGESIRASGGGQQQTQGSNGTATIRIRYAPPVAAQAQPPVEVQQAAAAQAAAEQGISINPFGELNALIIRYTNPALYQDVVDLVQMLDRPLRQVSIETKFVEVNESRAKEASADLSIAGLGSGRSIDWNAQNINTRFAQDNDEFRSAFEPPLESPTAASLLKGATVIEALIGNFPSITYELRLLEAEGIINVVSGPKVTTLDAQEAEFRIEGITPTAAAAAVANPTADITNALDVATTNFQLAIPGTAGTGGANVTTAVVLRVIPEITSEQTILFSPLEAELLDFENFAGNIVTPTFLAQPAPGAAGPFFQPILPPVAISNYPLSQTFRHKYVRSYVRVSSGGTIIVGGWTGERSKELSSGVPILRNMPYFGKLFFSRQQRSRDRTTLLIFLTATLVD